MVNEPKNWRNEYEEAAQEISVTESLLTEEDMASSEDKPKVLLFSPTTKIFWKISENLLEKRLKYKPEAFNFISFPVWQFGIEIYNWSTLF